MRQLQCRWSTPWRHSPGASRHSGQANRRQHKMPVGTIILVLRVKTCAIPLEALPGMFALMPTMQQPCVFHKTIMAPRAPDWAI